MAEKWRNFTEQQLRDIIQSSSNYNSAAKKMGYADKSTSGRKAVKTVAELYNISLSHFLNSGAKDLRNKKFGKLTVLEVDKDRKMANGHLYWKCLCECGNITSVVSSDLINGSTTSCGCKKFEHINEVGNRYGKLLVVEEAEKSKEGQIQWKCICDCGNETVVRGTLLRAGKTRSCGCLAKEQARINMKEYCKKNPLPWNYTDLTGQSFGKLTVIERNNDLIRDRAYWNCKCNCGSDKIITVSTCNLKSGYVSSCGCLRNQSKGNIKIKEILENMNLDFQQEYHFKDLKGKSGFLFFDFAIFKNKQVYCLIEYQGEQHYNPVKFFGGEEKFQEQIEYDNKKRKYCDKNKLQLIEIPYTDYNILNEKYIKERVLR